MLNMKCKYCSKEYSNKGIGTHIWRKHGAGVAWKKCNENRVAWNKGLTKKTDKRVAKAGKTLSLRWKKCGCPLVGRQLLEEHKKKVSEGMIRAHKEKRAWNIGKSRWNNKPSYPEIFFSRVIQNEFKDKNYKIEYPLSIYSLDFAWPHKKKTIEIDGAQHSRFEEYKKRDRRKTALIKKEGWKVLRIKWSYISKKPKFWIKKANDFVGA
jgi:very-short-patch-repair endonuclease